MVGPLGFEFTPGSGSTVLWPEQSELPSIWSKECDEKQVRVEVKPQRDADDEWIEIPTSEVRHSRRRAENDSFIHLAEIIFPVELGDADTLGPDGTTNVLELLKRTGAVHDSPFLKCRVSWKRPDGGYDVVFVGFASVASSTTKSVEGRMYIYDFLRMAEGITLNASFKDNVFLEEVIDSGIAPALEDSPIPFDRVAYRKVLEDESERELIAEAILVEEAGEGSLADLDEIQSEEGDFADELQNLPVANKLVFRENRDTIKTALDEITDKINARWWFSHNRTGSVNLVIDIFRDERQFIQSSVPESQREKVSDTIVSPDIDVIENNSLAAINPITTVVVLGKLSDETYPRAVAHATPLRNAAGEDAAVKKILEKDTPSGQEAERIARRELKKRVQQEGDGEIRVQGRPAIRPEDVITAYETCGDLFIGSGEDGEVFEPTDYQVKSVEHEQANGGIYETTATTSIHLARDDIESSVELVNPNK